MHPSLSKVRVRLSINGSYVFFILNIIQMQYMVDNECVPEEEPREISKNGSGHVMSHC